MFAVTDSAFAEIQRIFRGFHCEAPVARLYEKADTGDLFNDLKESVLDKSKTEDEIRKAARSRFAEVGNQLESTLEVGVSERAEFRAEDLFEVGGITFVMGPEARQMLSDCSLTFENGRFLLLDSDGAAHTLLSLARKSANC